MGINLISYAARRQAGMDARKVEDVVNDFGRNPVGEGREEQVCMTVCGWCAYLHLGIEIQQGAEDAA